jgi:hypothetical protein
MYKPKDAKEMEDRYGKPWESTKAFTAFENKWMTLWRSDEWEKRYCRDWPLEFKKIYCNHDLIEPLNQTFATLEASGLLCELRTFDGCFNVRPIRGTEKNPRWSVHSFGMALDFNAEENPLGGPVKFSAQFLACMEICGWTVGAFFQRQDGMHFQWTEGA